MDLFSKVLIFEPMKNHVYDTNITLISLVSLMFNHAKPLVSIQLILNTNQFPNK